MYIYQNIAAAGSTFRHYTYLTKALDLHELLHHLAFMNTLILNFLKRNLSMLNEYNSKT